MIKVLGHRGYAAKYPENSMAGFKNAMALGADGIECDIQKTRDGKFAVFHDARTGRFADKDICVNELDLAELKKINIGDRERIPELAELVAEMREGGIMNIELKRETVSENDLEGIREVLRSVKNDRLIISSFNHELLFYFKRKKMNVGLLIGKEVKASGFLGALFLIVKLRPKYLNIPVSIFEEFGAALAIMLLTLLRLLGQKMIFWVINSEDQLRKISGFADMVISDDPILIKSFAEEKNVRSQRRY